MGERIYLDNAATSWPKPETVYDAIDRYQREIGAPAGRGAYREAIEVERVIDKTRRDVAQLFNVTSSNRVIFTSGGTQSLNLAIHGILQPGDHVITSMAEHNSVLRPLRFLENLQQIEVSRVAVDSDGRVDPMRIRAEFRPATRMVILCHASNVTGAIQPVEEVGTMAREYGILFLVDAAQTAGHVPVDMQSMNADILAAPGHKGLLGPLGTGILCLQDAVEEVLTPVQQGGTGSRSSKDRQPDSLPDAYESGNANVPGIVGLSAGVDYVQQRGVQDIHDEEANLTHKFCEAIADNRRLSICGPNEFCRGKNGRVAVVSLRLEDIDPQEVASALDVAKSIQVRAGFHCSALVHEAIGTAESGTLRVSIGTFNDESQIAVAAETINQITATM